MENKQSIVLFGNNGDGKSSFTDAIEWFIYDDIEHLRSEGCGRDDFFNRALNPNLDANVSLSFSNAAFNSTKTLRRKGGSDHSNISIELNDFLDKIRSERLILRHHTMRAFIDKSKKDKLEDVEEIIGFGNVKRVRNELVRAKNALETDTGLLEARGKLTERKLDISALLGDQPINDTSVIAFANSLCKILSWEEVSDLSALTKIAKTADKELEESDRDKRLSILSEIEGLIPSFSSIKIVAESYKSAIDRHNKLVANRQIIESIALSKLYIAASDILSMKLTEPDKCPLCGNITDTQLLASRLENSLIEINKIQETRLSLLDEVEQLKNTVFILKQSIQKFIDNENVDKLISNKWMIFNDWVAFLSKWVENLDSLKSIYSKVILKYPSDDKWNELKAIILEYTSKISTQRKTILGSEKERLLYESMIKLKQLSDNYTRLIEIQEELKKYESQISSMRRITELFDKAENDALTDILNVLSENVNSYFTQYLHPDDNIQEIKLIPIKDRGIEFKVSFYGDDVCPPRRVLSESHLNSLGICLFLAAARYINQIGGFIVLDDVISSFDGNHRKTFARLLRDRFNDIQIILLTHDELWFNDLKNELPKSNWMFLQIGRWKYANGIQLIPFTPLTIKDEIIWLLDNNRVELAANKCRVYIEYLLKNLCDQLGVTGLEFRMDQTNDLREPSELISALGSYLKGNQSLRSPDEKQLLKDLRSDQLLTNIGSHHRNLNSTGLKRGDIEIILKDIDEFIGLYTCINCGKSVSRKYSPLGAKMKQCECGKLLI